MFVHDPPLDLPLAPDENDFHRRVSGQEFAAHGEGRIHVPSRAAPADDDPPHAHGFTPISPLRREMLRRMPTAARLQTSDERP